jgi:hypothetical protein
MYVCGPPVHALRYRYNFSREAVSVAACKLRTAVASGALSIKS